MLEHPFRHASKGLYAARLQGIRGFSLIEMAVVMVVLGLALGGLLAPLATQLESNDRKQAQAELKTIKEALIGHAMAEGRLPCPDTDNDGQENTQTVSGQQVCVRSYGSLPYHALAVGIEDPGTNPMRIM